MISLGVLKVQVPTLIWSISNVKVNCSLKVRDPLERLWMVDSAESE